MDNKKNFNVAILFLIYKNPAITQLTFNQIKKIKPNKLYISADGPVSENDNRECELTRMIVEEIDWPCTIEKRFLKFNLGLKNAVSSGISWFFSKEEEGIILEYDCFPNMDFFYFCEEMLNRYRNDFHIFSISGANLQGGIWRGDGDYYYSHFFGCWGWATWKRSWIHWTPSLENFEMFRLKKYIRNILLDNNVSKSYMRTLSEVYCNKNKTTWSFYFEYIQICRGLFTIVPNRNLISNIGFGANATHAKNSKHPLANIPTASLQSYRAPLFKIADLEADTLQNKKAFYMTKKDLIICKIKIFIKAILPKFIENYIKEKR